MIVIGIANSISMKGTLFESCEFNLEATLYTFTVYHSKINFIAAQFDYHCTLKLGM